MNFSRRTEFAHCRNSTRNTLTNLKWMGQPTALNMFRANQILVYSAATPTGVGRSGYLSYLFVEALERYHHFYADDVRVEFPTGSGKFMNLGDVSQELASRLRSIFLKDGTGRRPCHGKAARWITDPNWRELVLFHEYFHGESGEGLGASHQTGWTALVIRLIED